MITSIDVITGIITEFPDEPSTYVEPALVVVIPPTASELMAQLNAIQAQITALGVTA